MASRFSLARTIDIRVNQFPSGTNKFEIFNGLYDYFENQAYHKVVSIQECPGRMARVTFEAGGEASKDFFEERGVVLVNGVECEVIKPPPPVSTVIVYWYPFEAPDSAVNTALAAFGSVIEVRNQCWSARPAVSTGSKLVRMVIQKEIPRFIIINGIRVKIWYKGQPIRCDVCRKEGHKAASCPLRGKCLRCHEAGHLARNCSRSPWATTAVTAIPAEVDPAPELGDEALNGSTFVNASSEVPPPPPGHEGENVVWSEVVEEELVSLPPLNTAHLNNVDIQNNESIENNENIHNNENTANSVCDINNKNTDNNEISTTRNNSSYNSESVLTPGGNLADKMDLEMARPLQARVDRALVPSHSDTDSQLDDSSQVSRSLMSSASAPPDESSDSPRSRSRSPLTRSKPTPGQHSLPGDVASAAGFAVSRGSSKKKK